ncbi:MAG TPA: acylphosphatase [Pseudolabrys sp.]|nr:acylphosphatase [Pseudolabrys sp.]
MDDEPRIIRHILVRGSVQGVGFRAFVEHHARQRDLAGWVRNRRDGSVEAVFAGPAKSVEGMIAACGYGPLSARVDQVDQREGIEADLKVGASAGEFSLLPTA